MEGNSDHLLERGWHWRSLSCRQTFLLILLLFLIPLSLLAGGLWRKTHNEWHILHIASSSLSYHQRLSLLLSEVIEHQQLTQRFLLGDQTLHTALEKLNKRIDSEVAYIAQSAAFFAQKEEEEQESSFARVPLPLRQLVNSWNALTDSHEPLTEERNLSQHLNILESIRACLKILQERIALSAEGDLVTLLLDQLLYIYIPSLQQEMMQFASLGEQMAHIPNPPMEMRHRFIGTMALMKDTEAHIQLNGARAMHIQNFLNRDTTLQTILQGPFYELHETLNKWINEVARTIKQGDLIALEPFIRLSAHSIGESTQLSSSVMEQMERLTNQRISTWYYTTRSQVILFFITFLLILSAASYLFYKILQDVKQMVEVAQSIQKGNTRIRFPLNIAKEFSALSVLFNAIGSSRRELFYSLNEMKTIFKNFFQKANHLFEKQDQVLLEQERIKGQLLFPINTLFHAVEENLHAIQEAFEGLEKTSNSIKSAKDFIQNVSFRMNTLLKEAQELIEAFSLFDTLHQNATPLMSTMTKVADRTNLLSLNAAIEAKKIRPLSNGFDLIADEVRQLADQTGHLTKEMTQVILQMMNSMTASGEKMQKLFEGLELTSKQFKPSESTLITFQNHKEQYISWLNKLKNRIKEEEKVGEALSQALPLLQHTTQQITQMTRQLRAECAHLHTKLDSLQTLLTPHID